MITTRNLSYPVIVVDEDGYCMVAVDEDTLTTLNNVTLKRGGFDDCTFVDSNGQAAKVKETRRVAPKGRFLGFTIWLERMFRVEYTLSEPFEMPLEKLRAIVLRDVRRAGGSLHPDYYREELSRFKNAQTIREIIELRLPNADLKEFWK